MNLGNVRVVLRERDNLDVLDLALRFVLGLDLGVYVRVALVTLVPALAGCAALRFALRWDWAAVWVVAIVAATVLQGPFTLVAGRIVFGEPTRTGPVLRAFAARLPVLAAAHLVRLAALALGAVLLAAWIIPWARMTYLDEAVLLERASPGAAVRRSLQLVRGSFGRSLGLVVLLATAILGAVGVAELLGQAVAGSVLQLQLPAGELLDEGGSLYALAGFFAAMPVVATARFLAYLDQRTRRDGWELQVRLMDVAGGLGARA